MFKPNIDGDLHPADSTRSQAHYARPSSLTGAAQTGTCVAPVVLLPFGNGTIVSHGSDHQPSGMLLKELFMKRLLAAIALFITTSPAVADLMTVELVKKENTV